MRAPLVHLHNVQSVGNARNIYRNLLSSAESEFTAQHNPPNVDQQFAIGMVGLCLRTPSW